jgi:hypothetical protein
VITKRTVAMWEKRGAYIVGYDRTAKKSELFGRTVSVTGFLVNGCERHRLACHWVWRERAIAFWALSMAFYTQATRVSGHSCGCRRCGDGCNAF